jgi:ATP-dependent RNA helicase DeaD
VTPQEQWRLRRIEGLTKQPVTRIPIPTVEDIEKHREEQLKEQMLIGLKSNASQKELQLVARLAEMGHEPADVAAVALRIVRGEEKQRPISSISEVQENRLPKIRRGINAGRKENSHFVSRASSEKGMVRLTLNAGKSQGIRPADVVGTIAYHGNLPGHAIGDIKIMDKYTLIDVPQQYVAQTLAKSGKYRIRKNALMLTLA